MEAVGDVGSLLAAQNEHRTEPFALDRFDQVLHDAGVVERCRPQPCGSEDGVLSYAGHLNFDIVVDPNLVPDVAAFANGMADNLDRLGAKSVGEEMGAGVA